MPIQAPYGVVVVTFRDIGITKETIRTEVDPIGNNKVPVRSFGMVPLSENTAGCTTKSKPKVMTA